ncbi:MAG TPA: copper chaperone [Flavipsychrobacter sp.]|nr:copper chaperone [Flavipsychrobacter sp.]
MKRIFILFFSLIISITAFSQSDIKTEKFKVEGNCGMCKKRIEEAAFVKGVKRAEWDKQSHELTVIYRPSKTNTDAIATSIAKAGHSSEKMEAPEKNYKNLPECCQYKTHVCND